MNPKDNQKMQNKQIFHYHNQNDSSISTYQINQASLTNSFSLRDPQFNGNISDVIELPRHQTLDSNGNIIRCRKIDSPQLVVVRELRDQEDLEEIPGTYVDQDFLNFNSDHNDHYDFKNSLKNMDRNSDRKRRQSMNHGRSNKVQSRSQENNKKSRSQQKNHKAIKEGKNFNNQEGQTMEAIKTKAKNISLKGTKSSRDLKSSMGFNELLNQLDKDVSIQQSNQYDFKNKTTYDILKLELSGIRRQNSSGLVPLQNNIITKSQEKIGTKQKKGCQKMSKIVEQRSKSQDKKQHNTKKTGSQLPKSILKKNTDYVIKEQIFHYALNNADEDITPDKNQNHQGVNGTSFLHSEHGRCVTAQGTNQNISLLQQNGRTQSQPNINSSMTSNMNNLFSKLKMSNKNHLQSSFNHKQSPDRQLREFKAPQNIDKLVRNNIKKMKSREEEEKMQKLMDEDTNKRRKELQDYKNTQVRKINKEKTYRKQTLGASNFQNFQQSQEMRQLKGSVEKENKIFWDDKVCEINRNINNREQFMKKTSQTQKIDFDKIKETSKGRILNIKNHRKSYGLEFIDIKKEIQEELRTIDHKFKYDFSNKITEETPDSISDLEFTRPKNLKVKSQKKILLEKENTIPRSAEFISERIPPIDKIVVIKKNKIKKFMKLKKKTLNIQKIKEQRDEMIKTIKMQENISKLNDFCKKKLEKQVVKKKNTTIQVNEDPTENKSKLSGRKIVFENGDHKRTIFQKIEEEPFAIMDKDESSRLSTEFYEEYFRLITSIKKEQKTQQTDNLSRLETSSQNVTTKSFKNLLKSPTNKSQSSGNQNNFTQSKIFSPKQTRQNSKQLPSKGKSKSIVKNHENQRAQSKVGHQQKHTQISKSSLKGTDLLRNNHRAESAPLLLNQHTSIKKRSQLNLSPKKVKKQIKKHKKSTNQVKNEEQAMLYFLEQVIKIQKYYRLHLYNNGFYDELISEQEQQHSNESVEDYKSSEFQTQVYDKNAINVENINDDFSQEEPMINNQLETVEYGQEDEYENDEDEDQDNIEDMIIINQPSNDQNKVVYMSNINSCSLPQTPKDEEEIKKYQKLSNHQKVFDYKSGLSLQQDQFFSQKLCPNELLHQQISMKPSIESISSDVRNDSKFQTTLQQQNQSINENIQEEEKKVDYNMRLFTGSESLLREFKNNTPKQQHLLNTNKNLGSSQTSVRNITSSNSAASSNQLVINKIQHRSGVDSKSSNLNDNNSHSSQSLFERNSFQQFTMSKLEQMMKNNEYMNLIEMREKALEYRQVKEKKFIRKMYKNNQYSPRTYSSQKEKLEKWVKVENEEIQKTKKQFQEEWQKTLQMIEETQKNVDNMREKMKIQIDNNQKHHQFNSSSSRLSNSSYATISKQEPKKSILDQEEYQPISQRSLKQSMGPNQNDQAIPILNLKNQVKVEETNKLPKLNLEDIKYEQKEEGDLMDFLEESFQKKQKTDQRKIAASRQGIYIEDQNKKINSSQKSDQFQDRVNEFINQDDISQDKDFNQLDQSEPYKYSKEERPLTRSRSEQDLSELIQKSKLSLNELEMNQNEDYLNKDADSFRFDVKQFKGGIDNNDIKIQENLFDDSSNRYSKGKNYYQDMNELQSNDSLLNESELNNYFQEQKFSIEDFKSLDKRKILNAGSNEEDEDTLERNESQIILEMEEDSMNQNDKLKNDDDQKQIFNANQQPLGIRNENEDLEPAFIDQRNIQSRNNENQHHSLEQSDHIANTFLQHEQSYLFQHTKPGQNIRISDILKKSQSLTDPNSSTSFLNHHENSQILFQNQQINHSMTVPPLQPLADEQTKLVDQITEDLLSHLLSSEIQIPQRPLDNHQQQILLTSMNQSGDPSADIYMIDSQKNDKEQTVQLIDFRQRILIEQDLIKVENYINEVIQALQTAEMQYLTEIANNPSAEHNQNQQQNYHRQFLQFLTTPIKRNELDLLNQLQTSEIGSYEHFETTMDQGTNPILPIDLYLEIERQREESQIKLLYNNGPAPEVESSILQESTHIHNKSIFDSLNESLMKFRPYGIQGEPMPWSNKNRRLQTKVDTNSVDTERLFYMVQQDVLRWVQNFSGCQPTPIFVCKRNQEQEQELFDEEIFQETRERRLANMLATEVVENEHQWLNYEFEEAQVKIDLSDMILEHLVEEVAVMLNQKQGINTKEGNSV